MVKKSFLGKKKSHSSKWREDDSEAPPKKPKKKIKRGFKPTNPKFEGKGKGKGKGKESKEKKSGSSNPGKLGLNFSQTMSLKTSTSLDASFGLFDFILTQSSPVIVFAERNLIKSSFKGPNSLVLKMRYFIYRRKRDHL